MSAVRILTGVATAFAFLAFTGAAQANCGGLLAGILRPHCPPSNSPDPGGVESPDQPVPAPGKQFGFNGSLALTGVATPEEELGAARTAGATAHRMPVPWRAMQRTPGAPPVPEPADGNSVGVVDAFYAAALERGIRPVFITGWAPVWATKYRSCPLLDLACHSMARSEHTNLVPDRPFLDEYERYVHAVKSRWPQALIESWNEPNLWWQHPAFRGSRAFAASPEHFAQIQCAAYRGSKAVNGDAVLAAGWGWHRFSEYIGRVYAAGGKDCWDLANVHIYPARKMEFGSNTWLARLLYELRTLRSRYRDTDPIWVTEIGWTTSGDRFYRVSPSEQADATRRAYNRLVTMPDVAAVFFHTLRDAPAPNYQDPDNEQYGFGFLREDWSPKPAYCHFAAQAGNQPAGC